MLSQVFVVAKKELIDALRDVRPLVSSLLYCLMGPGLIFMVSLAINGKNGGSPVLTAMMSIFILVAAFVGGMNVAMDVLAGERERKSLLPLLMNGVTRRSIMIGKWLAVSCFSMGALVLNVLGFAFVLSRSGVAATGLGSSVLFLALGLLPLALFAAAVELGISTLCRSLKEAHTYLSMLVFLPMALGFFTAFFLNGTKGWTPFVPLEGQQWQAEQWIRGGGIQVGSALVLGAATLALTAAALWISAKLLERDEIVYGS